MSYLRQHSDTVTCDISKRWMMVSALSSGQLNLAAWEPYVPTRAQSLKHRAAVAEIHNARIQVEALYLPLVMAV